MRTEKKFFSFGTVDEWNVCNGFISELRERLLFLFFFFFFERKETYEFFVVYIVHCTAKHSTTTNGAKKNSKQFLRKLDVGDCNERLRATKLLTERLSKIITLLCFTYPRPAVFLIFKKFKKNCSTRLNATLRILKNY